MAKRINIEVNIEESGSKITANDITFEFKKGIFRDSVILKNNSGKPIRKGELTLNFDDKPKKKEKFKKWRSNAPKKYSSWFAPTPKRISLDIGGDEVDIAHEYQIKKKKKK